MLSQLARSFFGQSSVLLFPVLALLFFFAFFVVVFVRTYLKDKSQFARVASLPLEGDLP